MQIAKLLTLVLGIGSFGSMLHGQDNDLEIVQRLQNKGAVIVSEAEFIQGKHEKFGVNLVVTPSRPGEKINLDLVSILEKKLGTATVIPVRIEQVRLRRAEVDVSVQMIFTSHEFQKLLGIELIRGRFITPTELLRHDPVTVFPSSLFNDIPDEEPLHQVWKAGEIELKTVGVIQPLSDLAAIHFREFGLGDDLVFAPVTLKVDDQSDIRQLDMLIVAHQKFHQVKELAELVASTAKEQDIDVIVDALPLETERIRREAEPELQGLSYEEFFRRRIALVDLRKCEIDETVWDDIRQLEYCPRLVVGNIEVKTRAAMAIASLNGLKFLHLVDGTIIDEGHLKSIAQNNPECRILHSGKLDPSNE